MQAENARARAIWAEALFDAGVTISPKRTLSDAPDARFGYGTSRAQNQVPGEVRGLRLVALGTLASNLPPDDQCRRAFEKVHKSR